LGNKPISHSFIVFIKLRIIERKDYQLRPRRDFLYPGKKGTGYFLEKLPVPFFLLSCRLTERTHSTPQTLP
jgi:hypothetical protein